MTNALSKAFIASNASPITLDPFAHSGYVRVYRVENYSLCEYLTGSFFLETQAAISTIRYCGNSSDNQNQNINIHCSSLQSFSST